MPMRFLLEAPPGQTLQADSELTLPAERAHYLLKVLRLKAGDALEAFDGQGSLVQATVLDASTRRATVRIDGISTPVARPSHAVHLGMAILKGQAMDRALQQATELGAGEITLLNTQRGNVHLSAVRADNKMGHWQKIISSACEQCGRLFLPRLNPPLNLTDMLSAASGNPSEATLQEILVLDQHGEPLPRSLTPGPRMTLIGPEGGWDDSERELFKRQGLTRYSLGETVLRAETTPAVALALLNHLQKSDLPADDLQN